VGAKGVVILVALFLFQRHQAREKSKPLADRGSRLDQSVVQITIYV